MKNIEKKIEYTFSDSSLLDTALTHSSYCTEQSFAIEHNERLEYLGDAFLDAIISEELFRIFPSKEEGFLSRTRATLVCEKSLAIQARRLGIGEYIKLGRGEEKSGGRNRDSLLADAMEAIIGAVFLDGGYECTKTLVLRLFDAAIADAREGRFIITDYKTALQEKLQAEGIRISDIIYADTGEEGPDHDKTFTVSLIVSGKTLAEGKGKSKKQAQQNAAESVLTRRTNAV